MEPRQATLVHVDSKSGDKRRDDDEDEDEDEDRHAGETGL